MNTRRVSKLPLKRNGTLNDLGPEDSEVQSLKIQKQQKKMLTARPLKGYRAVPQRFCPILTAIFCNNSCELQVAVGHLD